MTALAFFGSTCQVDGDGREFQAVNKIRVYPGKRNHWLVVKTARSEGTINDFVEKYIVDPLDTSLPLMPKNVAFSITPVKAKDPVLNLRATGLRLQEKNYTALTPKIGQFTGPFEFWEISFVPPTNSAQVLPWPVQGCVENPGWYLSGATSDIVLKTGKPAANIAKIAEKEIEEQMRAEGKLTASDVMFRIKLAAGLAALGTLAYFVVPVVAGGATARALTKRRR